MPVPAIRRPSPVRVAPLALALLLVAGCGRDAREGAGVDSALARDLALATRDDVTPTFADTALGGLPELAPAPDPVAPVRRPVPVPRPARADVERPAPAPTRPRPAPVDQPDPAPAPAPAAPPAAAPGPRRGTIAAGTGVGLVTGDRVCTATAKVGDKIVGTVTGDVVGADGARIPAGSKAVLEVARIERGARPEDTRLVFRVRTLEVDGAAYSIVGESDASSRLERTRTEASKAGDRRKVIAGAIGGAILGQVLGKDTRGTIIGAAAGAAAGAGTAAVTAKHEGCLAAGSSVQVTLQEPVSVAIRE